MEPATATWLSGGITISVTTVQNVSTDPPESEDAWAARHKARVAAMLKVFPKDS